MAIQLRARSRAHPRGRERVRYALTPPAAAAGPGRPPVVIVQQQWRCERTMELLDENTDLRRDVALARTEIKALRQLTAGLQRERDAARRTLAILAQQALEREWMPDDEGAS